jgi:adenosylhomocysteine nucleosidase
MKDQRYIGIIGAMKVEVDAICASVTDAKVETVSGIRFVMGCLGGRPVVVAQCGIGKVYAAMCAQTMILRYQPAVILNTGVGGCLTDKLSIGDIAIADHVVEHDMDTSPLGDPVGFISGLDQIYMSCTPSVVKCLADCADELNIPYTRGIVASGDQFISSEAKKKWIHEQFDRDEWGTCVACEMEGAAIGQVCCVNNVPFGIVRAISDKDDAMDYSMFVVKAADMATRVTQRFVASFN